MAERKRDVISLKVDRSLAEALDGMANRSEFIRDAILAALDNVCPLCMGTGILSPQQKTHWASFARDHSVRQCPDCHERHLTCDHETPPAKHPRKAKASKKAAAGKGRTQ